MNMITRYARARRAWQDKKTRWMVVLHREYLAERAVVAISSTMGERVRGGKSASALTVRLLKLFVLGEVGSRTSC